MTTDDLVTRLRALSDPRRLLMIRLLASNDLCVTSLAERSGVSSGAVSQHLRILREAGLVRGEKRGYWTHYVVDSEAIASTGRLLAELATPRAGTGCTRDCRQDCHAGRSGRNT